MAKSVCVVPDQNFDDWVVRDDSGRELGHYATRDEAELLAKAIARERQGDVVIVLPDGREQRVSFAKNRLQRLLEL